MNSLSFIEKLLDGYKVEKVVLGKVAKYEQPTKYLVSSTEYDDSYPTPVLTAGKTFILGYTDEKDGIYEASIKPVIIFDDFTTANKWVDFDFKAKSSAMKMISSTDESLVLSKYIYYWLNTLPNELNESDHKRQWISNYAKKKIPIPCPDNPEKSLKIQNKIVDILDSFTELTAELTSELTAREKQYGYYRDLLLSEAELNKTGFELRTIENIAVNICSGGTPMTSVAEYYDGEIPWLRTQEVDFKEVWDTRIKITEEGVQNSSAKWIPENCVIVAMYGATVGKVAINKIPMTTNQACANIQLNPDVANYRYVFHYLCSQYENIKSLGTGSQTNINLGIVKKLQIPIPPLKEQVRIVSILDKFHALTNSITDGLPREIELRQKQYEYYRDLLFSFPKSETV
jgi:type I restriction enzyme S subunit